MVNEAAARRPADLSVLIFVQPGGEEQLSRCLESLRRTLPPRLPAEVILVPGGVGDSSRAPLPTPPPDGWRVLPPGDAWHQPLAARRNAAVAATRAATLCLLDSGTVLLPGWLPPMLDLLRRAPRAGCVGNLHREPYSGLIEHAGWRFDAEGLPTAGPTLALPPRETWDRHPAVSLACAVFARALFERVGGFDERFHGLFGDVDFCLRTASVGCRHYVTNRSVVYHFPGTTLNPSTAADRVLYRERWGNRARAAHLRRAFLRAPTAVTSYSPEAWELAREDRRLQRLQILQTRRDGRTYLCKHLHRPWRYNYARLCTALGKALHPLPPALPLAPGSPASIVADTARPDDGWLFDPPPQ